MDNYSGYYSAICLHFDHYIQCVQYGWDKIKSDTVASFLVPGIAFSHHCYGDIVLRKFQKAILVAL